MLLINKWCLWKSKNMDKTIYFFNFYFRITLFNTCLFTLTTLTIKTKRKTTTRPSENKPDRTQVTMIHISPSQTKHTCAPYLFQTTSILQYFRMHLIRVHSNSQNQTRNGLTDPVRETTLPDGWAMHRRNLSR